MIKQFLPNMPATKITILLDGAKPIANGYATRIFSQVLTLLQGTIKTIVDFKVPYYH